MTLGVGTLTRAGLAMKRTTAFLAAITFCAACSTAYALYSVMPRGLAQKLAIRIGTVAEAVTHPLVGPMAPSSITPSASPSENNSRPPGHTS